MQKLLYIANEKLKPVWTADELIDIKKLLNKRHSVYLENESFEIESGSSHNQVQISVSLKKNDNTACYPIECVFIKETGDVKESEIAMKMIDYLDIYWTNYFSEERNVFIPLDWSKHDFEGIMFYIRGFIRKPQLETYANNLLLEHGYGDYDIQPISSET